jgi:hypothetical protein
VPKRGAPNISRPPATPRPDALDENTPSRVVNGFVHWSPQARYAVKVGRQSSSDPLNPRAEETTVVSVYSKQKPGKPSKVSCCDSNLCAKNDVTDVAISADEASGVKKSGVSAELASADGRNQPWVAT